MHFLILRQAVLFKAPSKGCRKWCLGLRGTAHMSPEERNLGEKKPLIWLEHSWENKAYQPAAPFRGQTEKHIGYCVTEKSV